MGARNYEIRGHRSHWSKRSRPAYCLAMMGKFEQKTGDQANIDDPVDFGFDEVPRGEKSNRVGAIFSSVAGRYDLMNDLMSGGVHRLWKAALLDQVKPRPGMRLLDVAGGTGDIARAFSRHLAGQAAADITGQAIVCDINFEMVAAGRDQAIDKPQADGARIDWLCGDAEHLPAADRQFDVYTIGFGLRNVTDRAAALKEARRVLKPGGHFLCLEFAPVDTPLLGVIYDRYSFNILPRIGAAVTGDRAAYQYLVESIRRFPRPADLVGEIEAAGFGQARYQILSGGIAAIHSAWRI